MYERGFYVVYLFVDLYYDIDGGNVFIKLNLQRMQMIENEFVSLVFFLFICMMYNFFFVCKFFQFILCYFDGIYKYISVILDDFNFNNILGVLYEVVINNDMKFDFLFFFLKGYSLFVIYVYGMFICFIMVVGCFILGIIKCVLKIWRIEIFVYLKKIKIILEKYVDDFMDDFKFYFYFLNLWLFDVLW